MTSVYHQRYLFIKFTNTMDLLTCYSQLRKEVLYNTKILRTDKRIYLRFQSDEKFVGIRVCGLDEELTSEFRFVDLLPGPNFIPFDGGAKDLEQLISQGAQENFWAYMEWNDVDKCFQQFFFKPDSGRITFPCHSY